MVITITKENRETWTEFSYIVRLQKKEVWEVLEPLLKQYIKKYKKEVKK